MSPHRQFLGTLAVVWIAFAGSVHAEPLTCPDQDIRIQGASDPERLCTHVADTIRSLEHCGLTKSAPITIRIVTEPINDNPVCLGQFHCQTSEIMLRTPAELAVALGPSHPLSVLDPDRLFDSLVVHELAHALLYQSRGAEEGQTRSEDEYVAYAMQYGFLTEAERAAVLAGYKSPDFDLSFLNDVTYAFAPGLFGSMAWRHFARQENGCDFVRGIVAGEHDFMVHEFYEE